MKPSRLARCKKNDSFMAKFQNLLKSRQESACHNFDEVTQNSYIFLNWQFVLLIVYGVRGEVRRPVKSGCGTVCCPKLQRLRGDLWARELYFKACGGGILVFFIKT